MSKVDLKQVAQDVAGWRGRFYVADEDEDTNDQIWFASAADDLDVAIMESTGDVDNACAPISRMLNAVPVLLAEVERLRSLGRNACVLAKMGPGRERAKELLAEIERKEPTP